MTTFEKLAKRIKKDCDIELEAFERLYVGHWQRSNGAWVWIAYRKGTPFGIGSSWSATDLLKSKKPIVYQERSINGHDPEFVIGD